MSAGSGEREHAAGQLALVQLVEREVDGLTRAHLVDRDEPHIAGVALLVHPEPAEHVVGEVRVERVRQAGRVSVSPLLSTNCS